MFTLWQLFIRKTLLAKSLRRTLMPHGCDKFGTCLNVWKVRCLLHREKRDGGSCPHWKDKAKYEADYERQYGKYAAHDPRPMEE